VVIDFIDMRDNKHNKEVERTLKDALKIDKARVNLGRISQFGMMEMSRQRIAKNINDAIHLECPHCEGRGRVKSAEAMALSFLRKVHAAAAKGQLAEVRGALPLEVAYYLLNRKKRDLAQIENDYDIVVTIKGKPSFLLNQLELEVIRREKPEFEEKDAEVDADSVIDVTPTQGDQSQEAVAKKKRRRKKKKKTNQAIESQEVEISQDLSVEENEPDQDPQSGNIALALEQDDDVSTEDLPKKRRRSRPRKKKSKSVAVEAALETPQDLPTDAPQIEMPQDDPSPVPKAASRQRKAAKALIPDPVAESADLPSELKLPAVKTKPARNRTSAKAPKVEAAEQGEVLSEEIKMKPKSSRKPSVPKAARKGAKTADTVEE
jgi:ribonuclease E